jgi:tetratricopeptide (TPR) repeat protein
VSGFLEIVLTILGVCFFVILLLGDQVSLRDLIGGGAGGGSQVTQDERSVNVGNDVRAPVTTGDNSPVEVTYGDRIILPADKEVYQRFLMSETGVLPAQPPPTPLIFSGRDRELAKLKARLIGDSESGGYERENPVVLTGIPGVGKSALAAKAVADSDVKEAFPDGTLWISLGPSPAIVEELGALARRLGAADATQPQDLTEAQAQVASLLSGKEILLVVDDVYRVADAAAFRLSGGGGTTLMTTRDREVARQIAPGHPGPIVLSELDRQESFDLLAKLVPEVIEQHGAEVEELVQELGGLPLTLRVAGSLLAAEERMGWGIEDLLTDLREGQRVLKSEAPADRLPAPEGTSPTVAVLLQTSLERLSREVRARFRMLGAFPSKPVSFDLVAAAKVWGMEESEDARETLRELAERGLLEPAESGRFYLHPILSAYARLLLGTSTEAPTLRDAFLQHASHYEQVLDALGELSVLGGEPMTRALTVFDQERPHMDAGQRWAEKRYREDREAAKICSGYGRAAPRLILSRLIPSERRRWLESAVSAAEVLGDQEARQRNEGLLATAYLDAGVMGRPFEILERHLDDARAAGNRWTEMEALGNLGNAYLRDYEAAKGEECHRQVLDIAQQVGDKQFEAQALGALGEAHDSRGEHPQAQRMFRQRLTLARQIEDLRSEARALRELGTSSRRAGCPYRACVLLRSSLRLFETLGDRNEQGNVLNALGIALAELNDLARAKDCFGRALVLAREEEAPRLEADVVGNLGKVADQIEGDSERAIELFEEQFEIANSAGDKINQANASLSIAAIHSMEDRLQEAISHGRRALHLYEEIGDARAGEAAAECIQRWENQGRLQ